ncbi:MAG: eukaryotic-like serine/threonine-protein kinase [Actinomycetota bacterium]
MPETTAITEGTLIGGRYRLVARLARGGMAEVWEAEDDVLTRPVAVKVLLPHLAADGAFHERFHREAMSAARLSHPHIVSIYDTCSGDDIEAIVMELVRGTTVRDLLDRKGTVSPRRAIAITRQVADALAHAHACGLVHRDIKPGNILLADDGRVLVTDFGIAKAAEAVGDLTEAGQVVGTAKYLSPEQVRGEPLDGRSDVYALGVVLYELLCGRPPFAAETSTATALARLTTEPLRPRQVRAGLSRELEDVVLKAMARRPEDRFPTAAAMCSALDGIDLRNLDGEEGADDASTGAFTFERDDTPTPAPRFSQTERSWIVPAALIVVVAVTLAIVGLAVGGTDVGRHLLDAATGKESTTAGHAVTLGGAATSFDPPPGSSDEHDSRLGAATDGNASTTWATEHYDTRRFGGLKDGVGIVLHLNAVTALDRIELTSPTKGWSVEVFVAQSAGSTLSSWGDPAASRDNIDGSTTLALHGARGAAVLVWITDLGDGTVGDRFSAAIAEARLVGS